jgi:hypothetical protein
MRTVSIFTTVIVVLAALQPVYGSEECTAAFRIDLTSQQDAVLHFKVMVTTNAPRAQIDYDLLLTVASDSGESRVVRLHRVVMIGGGTVFDLALHTLGSGESLVSSEAELVTCRSKF